jgi:hypothetical protein
VSALAVGRAGRRNRQLPPFPVPLSRGVLHVLPIAPTLSSSAVFAEAAQPPPVIFSQVVVWAVPSLTTRARLFTS